ncbi:MAG: GGDEF domain-containing protein [Desulfobacteraceae bacterium]|nr:GGDEF domain-containing protein [Desulfobacteraceae bacterium]
MNMQLTMQGIKENGLHFLLGNTEKFSFHRQLINAATLFSTIISLMGVIASYVIDLQLLPLILSFVSVGVFFTLYGIGRWRGYYAWVVWAYLIFNYIFLFFYWLLIDAYMGICLPIILLLTCILPILLSGWQLFLALISNCIVLMAVYLSVIIFPRDLINQEPSIQYLLERFFSMILLGAGLSLPALLVSRNYRFQQDRIKKLTLRDGLTGLHNRQFFNQIFQREINRSRRDNKYLSLLMIDVDEFKNYNDKYGHEKGDEALISIGRLLMRLTTRGSDYVFRLGGEEFAVIFSGLDPEAACVFSEKIRSEIEHLGIEHIGNSTGIFMSASLGLAAILPSEDMNMDWYYHKADQGLYEAKQGGKNKVGIV